MMQFRWIPVRCCRKLNFTRSSIREISNLSSRKPTTAPLASIDVPATIQGMIDRFLISSSFPDTLKSNLAPVASVQPVVYAGFDPTADSLHIGNLLAITALLHFYSAGFDVIALVGGATAKLGDPSGRSNERTEMDRKIIERNCDLITAQLQRLFCNFEENFLTSPDRREQLKPVKFVNNVQWYADVNVIDFLASVGRQFRLKHMLQKDSVRARIASNEGMNFAEFSYQIFQAYDWLRLYEDFGCLLQIGGSDQIGNMHSGHDLIQRVHDKTAFGFAMPLLLDDKGQKLGKSTSNAKSSVWLDSKKTTPFEFYQHFIRLSDVEVSKLLYLFTFFPLGEVEKIVAKHNRMPEARLGQTKLATQLTLLVHGPDGLATAERCTDALYNGSVEKLSQLAEDEFQATFSGAPLITAQFRIDTTVLELALLIGHFGSDDRMALDTIRQGGLSINYQKVREPNCILVSGVHVLPNGCTVVRVGKKNYYVVSWN